MNKRKKEWIHFISIDRHEASGVRGLTAFVVSPVNMWEKSLKRFFIFLNKIEMCVSGPNPPAGSSMCEQSVSVPALQILLRTHFVFFISATILCHKWMSCLCFYQFHVLSQHHRVISGAARGATKVETIDKRFELLQLLWRKVCNMTIKSSVCVAQTFRCDS